MLTLMAVFTAARVYARYVLPAPPGNWNATQLARTAQAYAEEKKKFYDTGDPENSNGFSLAIFGDVHNSVHTYDKLIRRINQSNVTVGKKLAKLEAALAEAQRAEGMSPGERDQAVLALKKKINETRKEKILFAVVNGDLTISGNEVQYRMLLKRTRNLEVPILTLPGNHDAKASPSDIYSKIFGPRYYSFSVGEDYFIMLDDSDQVRIAPEQMKWFEEELKESEKYRYCTVFMHVPAFKGHRDTEHSVTIPWKEYLADRDNANAFKALCQEYEVSFVVGSHLHTFDFDIWDMSSDLDHDGIMSRNKEDGMVWTIITGGAGAQLWKTFDWRAVHHYFVVEINGEFIEEGLTEPSFGIQFDRISVESRYAERWYLLEKIWTYTLTSVVNNYLWVMPLFMLALIGLLVALVKGGKARQKESSRDL